MHVSIIIPALNEAACIERTLKSLQHQARPFEIIVADGGSGDATATIAKQYATVVHAKRGRANQMNAGAAASSGDVLLFLHADSKLPPDGLSQIRETLTQKAESGTFRLQFDTSSPLLGFYSFFTRFRLPKFSFGDRGLFVKRSLFDELGGFAAIPIFEDLEIVQRLHKRGSFTFLPSYVTTAARRFEQHGYLKQQLLNGYLWLSYQLGNSPESLASRYRYNTCSSPVEDID